MIALDLIICLLLSVGLRIYRRFSRSDYERILRYTGQRIKNNSTDADVTMPLIVQWHDLAASAHNALVDLTIAIERTVILSGMIVFLGAIIVTCDLAPGVIVWLVTIMMLLLGTIAWQLAKYIPLFTEAKAMLAEFPVPAVLLEDFARWDTRWDNPAQTADVNSSPFTADNDANAGQRTSYQPLSRHRLAARRALTHSSLRWRDKPITARIGTILLMLVCVLLLGLCALCLAAGFMFGVDHGWHELQPVERGWQMMALGVGFGFAAWLVWWRARSLLSNMPRLRLRWQADWRLAGLQFSDFRHRLAYVPSPLDHTLRLDPADANQLAMDDPLRDLTFEVSPLGLLTQINGDPVLHNTRVYLMEEHWMQQSRMMYAAMTNTYMLVWESFALTVSEPGLEPRVTLHPNRCWMIPYGITRRDDNSDTLVIEGVRAHKPFRIRLRIEEEETR
ncbi:hypothetical protein D2E25_1162 [Bifidobacterium goeldii]|uniref:Uncharacterized protein n=1 Tax=Bifidobacterium goeldii TaxID=2306975 RepID=A0A430FJX8_9BIFI|nr:hypothetical protein [Bifidobacterium goeldii]RSX53189.1 hypothetical protein D2E25_1162 [Bifidobacterium goeldii]